MLQKLNVPSKCLLLFCVIPVVQQWFQHVLLCFELVLSMSDTRVCQSTNYQLKLSVSRSSTGHGPCLNQPLVSSPPGTSPTWCSTAPTVSPCPPIAVSSPYKGARCTGVVEMMTMMMVTVMMTITITISPSFLK